MWPFGKKKKIIKKSDSNYISRKSVSKSQIGVVSVVCDFGGQKAPFDFYIGVPEATHHPVYFQNNWLGTAKGGSAPAEWLESIKELHEMSVRNGVDFKELVMYVMSLSLKENEVNKIQDL